MTALFRELFGLKFVPASALGFDRKAAVRGRSIYEDLREKIRASDKLHADETSWRNDGLNHYVWYAGNDHLAFFHLDRHRSAEVAKSIFGKDFQGTLIRDRYAAYNGIGLQLASLSGPYHHQGQRNQGEHALLPQPDQDILVDSFAGRVQDFFSKACQTGQKLKAGVLAYPSAKGLKISSLKNFPASADNRLVSSLLKRYESISSVLSRKTSSPFSVSLGFHRPTIRPNNP